MKFLLWASMAAILAAACGGSTDPRANAQVRFVTDAPFCSDPRPVSFFIDNVQVGRDTMWFGVTADTSPFIPPVGSQKYKAYRSFGVQAGIHTIGAIIVDMISPYPPFIYRWPDTTINVAAGAEVVRNLPFYCS
jgi:hypothetical protein